MDSLYSMTTRSGGDVASPPASFRRIRNRAFCPSETGVGASVSAATRRRSLAGIVTVASDEAEIVVPLSSRASIRRTAKDSAGSKSESSAIGISTATMVLPAGIVTVCVAGEKARAPPMSSASALFAAAETSDQVTVAVFEIPGRTTVSRAVSPSATVSAPGESVGGASRLWIGFGLTKTGRATMLSASLVTFEEFLK